MSPLINNILYNLLLIWALVQSIWFGVTGQYWQGMATATIGIVLCYIEIRHRDRKP